MAEESRLRLGRGLAALIGDAGEDSVIPERNRNQRRAPIEFLRANPRNPRKTFEEVALEELANSIREKGVLQPIVVRELSSTPGAFEIVAGERRWRAAQRAGIHNVPIIVVEATDKESLEIAIIENVQRTDLNALEEADGYAQLIQEFDYTQAELAKIIGKSRSHVANTLRLSNLPDVVKSMLSSGRLSAGHARALLGVQSPERLAQKIIDDGLTVREAEKLTQERAVDGLPPQDSKLSLKLEKGPDTRALEKSMQETLGLSVEIKNRGESGEIRIRYKTLEQFDQICNRLSARLPQSP